jgi:ferredoxin
VTLVRFHKADGTLDKEVEAKPGQRLLDVAWANGQPLEGACEGVMACSTCHVIVEPEDFVLLPPASEEEEDLLDIAAHVTRTSRLACQILLSEELQSLSVRMPPGARNDWYFPVYAWRGIDGINEDAVLAVFPQLA